MSNQSNNQSNSQAMAVISKGFMEGAVDRRNANGGFLGKRMSFVGSVPAGDVRKHLAATGVKGKELKRQVAAVMRGEMEMGWALYYGQLSVQRSMGFAVERQDSNKDGTVLTTRMVLVPPTREKAALAAAASLSDSQLLALLEERKSSAAGVVKGEVSKATPDDKAGAVEIGAGKAIEESAQNLIDILKK
jgi:hypothetical protein